MIKKTVPNIQLKRYFTPDNLLWFDDITPDLNRLLRGTRRRTNPSELANLAIEEMQKKSLREIEKLLRKTRDSKVERHVNLRPKNADWLYMTAKRTIQGANESQLLDSAVTALKKKSPKQIAKLLHQRDN